MVYKHAYLNTLLLLHSTFMLSLVKMPLKREVGGHALNSHGNYIVDREKSWKNHGIVFLYPRYEVYRGYIVFAFSVIMFVCLSVCLSVNFFFRQRFLSNYLG